MEHIMQRLEKLRSLKEGWLDGEGEAISNPAITRTEALFRDSYNKQFQMTCIYPVVEGGLLIEGDYDNKTFSIDIDENGFVEFFMMNFKDNSYIVFDKTDKIDIISERMQILLKYMGYTKELEI